MPECSGFGRKVNFYQNLILPPEPQHCGAKSDFMQGTNLNSPPVLWFGGESQSLPLFLALVYNRHQIGKG